MTRPAVPLDVRLAKGFERDEATGCLNWTGRLARGYGSITVEYRKFATHRLMWELSNGAIPRGFHVFHQCRNRRCGEVDHMVLATGRNAHTAEVVPGPQKRRGESHRNAKLTPDAVREIIARSAGGDAAASLAKQYGVSQTAIWLIVTGRSWRHLSNADNMAAALESAA